MTNALHPIVRRALAATLVGAVLPALLAACGYRQDVPRMVGGARNLAIERVDNRTDQGELDVRLRAALLHRLSQHAQVRLVPPADAAVALTVQLDAFSINRTLDPAITRDRSFAYRLSGSITLTDLRTGRNLLEGAAVRSRVGLAYAPGVLETPGIRDEGINAVVAAFAEAVERRLFLSF